MGNGIFVPLLDLELSPLQELSNSTTGLRLHVHLTDAMATNMSAVAVPVSLKVKLGTQLGPPKHSSHCCDVAIGLTRRSKVGELYVTLSSSSFQPYIYPKRPSLDSCHVTIKLLQYATRRM